MDSVCGIYAITCTPNGRVYIGSSVNISKRWKYHRFALRKGTHDNRHMQNAWNKYGEESFTFSIVLACNPCELIEREQSELNAQRDTGPVFNIGRVCGAEMRGRKHTPEARANMSAAQRGRVVSAECRAKLSEINKGKRHTPESRAKMSISNRGRIVSAEARERGASKMRGRPFTDAHKASLSAAKKGKPITESHRAQLAAARLNRGPRRKKEPCVIGPGQYRAAVCIQVGDAIAISSNGLAYPEGMWRRSGADSAIGISLNSAKRGEAVTVAMSDRSKR